MGYSRICNDDYYLLWDSDTVPVKKIDLFDDDRRPYFDYKHEYHKPYFDTIKRLFPQITKQIKGSFIAEHMIICTQYMQNLLQSIESNNNVKGADYIEKIINAVDVSELPGSGFSEFETYGSFVLYNYPDRYRLREWRSLRFGGLFFDEADKLHDRELQWLARSYDAVSFEKKDSVSWISKYLTSLEKFFDATALDYLSIPIRGFRKMKDLCKSH